MGSQECVVDVLVQHTFTHTVSPLSHFPAKSSSPLAPQSLPSIYLYILYSHRRVFRTVLNLEEVILETGRQSEGRQLGAVVETKKNTIRTTFLKTCSLLFKISSAAHHTHQQQEQQGRKTRENNNKLAIIVAAAASPSLLDFTLFYFIF